MAKKHDITKKNDKELSEFIKEQREAVRQERFAVAGSRGRDVKSIREAKRNIARALTAQRARQS